MKEQLLSGAIILEAHGDRGRKVEVMHLAVDQQIVQSLGRLVEDQLLGALFDIMDVEFHVGALPLPSGRNGSGLLADRGRRIKQVGWEDGPRTECRGLRQRSPTQSSSVALSPASSVCRAPSRCGARGAAAPAGAAPPRRRGARYGSRRPGSRRRCCRPARRWERRSAPRFARRRRCVRCPAAPTWPPMRTKRPTCVLPERPTWAARALPSPIEQPCAIITRLSILAPRRMTVAPTAARSTVVLAPISTSSSSTTVPAWTILRAVPSAPMT